MIGAFRSITSLPEASNSFAAPLIVVAELERSNGDPIDVAQHGNDRPYFSASAASALGRRHLSRHPCRSESRS
jgi:hypothetical protein